MIFRDRASSPRAVTDRILGCALRLVRIAGRCHTDYAYTDVGSDAGVHIYTTYPDLHSSTVTNSRRAPSRLKEREQLASRRAGRFMPLRDSIYMADTHMSEAIPPRIGYLQNRAAARNVPLTTRPGRRRPPPLCVCVCVCHRWVVLTHTCNAAMQPCTAQRRFKYNGNRMGG